MIFIPIILTLAIGWSVFSDKPQTKTTQEIYREAKEGKR